MKITEFVERCKVVEKWLWNHDRDSYWTFKDIRDKYVFEWDTDKEVTNDFDLRMLKKYESKILGEEQPKTIVKTVVVERRNHVYDEFDAQLDILAGIGAGIRLVSHALDRDSRYRMC